MRTKQGGQHQDTSFSIAFEKFIKKNETNKMSINLDKLTSRNSLHDATKNIKNSQDNLDLLQLEEINFPIKAKPVIVRKKLTSVTR